MRHGHLVAVHRIPVDAARRGEMRDDLVAEEVEIDPGFGRPPFGAAHQAAVEAAGRGKVIDGKGQMKRLKAHRATVASTCRARKVLEGPLQPPEQRARRG